jgi:hypothetical protein
MNAKLKIKFAICAGMDRLCSESVISLEVLEVLQNSKQ